MSWQFWSTRILKHHLSRLKKLWWPWKNFSVKLLPESVFGHPYLEKNRFIVSRIKKPLDWQHNLSFFLYFFKCVLLMTGKGFFKHIFWSVKNIQAILCLLQVHFALKFQLFRAVIGFLNNFYNIFCLFLIRLHLFYTFYTIGWR